MKTWFSELIRRPQKKALPVLSFPSVQLLGISVRELISDSETQARGMKCIADRVDSAAAVSMMDLSVEAECFGAPIRIFDDEVPTVLGGIVSSQAEADALAVPPVGSGRSGVYVDAIRRAAQRITDRPVFAGAIGPFSLAGRLMDVTQAMLYCYDEPELVHILLHKATDFIIAYCRAYAEVGADGVFLAEPLAGLLSPSLAEEFSSQYVRRIVSAVQTDSFAVVYHNCGNAVLSMMDSIVSVGAMGYHFGDAVDMTEVLSRTPSDVAVMGNISPSARFRNGTPEEMRQAVRGLLEACAGHPNFVISSGCDLPPLSRWENIDAFFAAVAEFYRS